MRGRSKLHGRAIGNEKSGLMDEKAQEVASVSKRGAMKYYRLYYLGGRDGRIDHFREFEASYDSEAIIHSGQWRSTVPMELWCRGRKVIL